MPETTGSIYYDGFFAFGFEESPQFPCDDVDRAFWQAGQLEAKFYHQTPDEALAELLELESKGFTRY